MKTPAPADLQRWSEEVARDPSSLAFLPLARAYRRLGQRAAAMQLCLRGLQHYPTHAEGHSLLALLYLEDDQHDRAADEWSMVLRLDPNNFDALRGLGFCYLEQDQLSRARQTLERAALQRPHDPAVQEALRLLGTRQELQSSAAAASPAYEPWAEHIEESMHAAPQVSAIESLSAAAAHGPAAMAAAAVANTSAPPPPPAPPAAAGARAADASLPADPTQLFANIGAGGPALGALLLDERGLVLAGALDASLGADADALGAMLGGAIGEAARTASHLSLGDWQGILLESESAVLHVTPVSHGGVVVLAARRNAPTGWVLRVSGQASELAGRYLEAYA